MNNFQAGTILALFGLASIQAIAGDYAFTPGLWETTTTVEVTGVPAQMAAMMKVPPRTEKDCIKENDIMLKNDGDCTYDKKRVNAHKMLVAITCNTPQGPTKGKGEINFDSKSSSGWFEMNMQGGPAGPMKMKNTFKSKYIGKCK